MSTSGHLPMSLFEFYQGPKLIMHLGLGMTLFFPRPFIHVRDAMWDFWQQYIAFVGKDKFTWARLGGGNRSRTVNPLTFRTVEAWLTGTKDYGKNCWISIHDGPLDCLGRYGFELEGLGEPSEDEEDVGCVDVSFPIKLLDSGGGPAFADALVSMAEKIPFYCGVAGFIFHRSPHKYDATIGKVAALSKRFEGVEIRASHRERYWAAKGLVSVNWITFVGEEFVTRAGGYEHLSSDLPAGCVAIRLDHGTAIRAGDTPLLGDKNTGQDELSLWRELYKVLKPVQFVETAYAFDPFEFDGERTADWLQRLES